MTIYTDLLLAGFLIFPAHVIFFPCPQEAIKTITDREGHRLQRLVEDAMKEEREASKVCVAQIIFLSPLVPFKIAVFK